MRMYYLYGSKRSLFRTKFEGHHVIQTLWWIDYLLLLLAESSGTFHWEKAITCPYFSLPLCHHVLSCAILVICPPRSRVFSFSSWGSTLYLTSHAQGTWSVAAHIDTARFVLQWFFRGRDDALLCGFRLMCMLQDSMMFRVHMHNTLFSFVRISEC